MLVLDTAMDRDIRYEGAPSHVHPEQRYGGNTARTLLGGNGEMCFETNGGTSIGICIWVCSPTLARSCALVQLQAIRC